MSKIDDMLRAPWDAALPPLIRMLKARLAEKDELSVEVDKPESALGSSTVEMVIHRKENGTEQAPQRVEWDDELNAAVVNLGVRAVDQKNEAERAALGLRAALRTVERQYGDGYLNSVLVDLIDESELGHRPEIADVRQGVQVNRPERNSAAFARCREQIASAVGARAAELREKLKYDQDELNTIMGKAIATYLDERFSVSRRRALGWL